MAETSWRLRCTSCGKTRDAADAGVVRVGAWSFVKRTLGWCRDCRALRFVAVEPRRD